MIWHLHLAGFQAGRQRNPSGAISIDKLTIVHQRRVEGVRHLHRTADVPGVPLSVIWWPS